MCFSKLFRKKENDMQYTEKLELNLPETDDYIEDTSREAWNDNFEIIETSCVLKDDIAIVTGSVTLSEGAASTDISYPTGFTQTNCIVVAFGCYNTSLSDTNQYSYGFGNHSSFLTAGCVFRRASMKTSAIQVDFRNISSSGAAGGSSTINFKIALLKIS